MSVTLNTGGSDGGGPSSITATVTATAEFIDFKEELRRRRGGTEYVRTDAIKAAVRGRESDVLYHLGIGWNGGNRPITCPYPTHSDNHPSWRWDESKAVAFCSCESGVDIFGVVMRVKKIDFAEAKIVVAHALGLENKLVKTRRGDGTSYQTLDPASLLNAPDENRDDDLVPAYLGHRLGVTPSEVVMPSTRYAGISKLGYFDPPPPRKRGQKTEPKPVHVGDYPCTVFEMTGPDGRSHAHRIYVAPAGAGKADFGADADGNPRDPKKLCRFNGEGSTAGMSVLFGDPNTATHCILCEGIETGAALAYAFRDEIAAGEFHVAAAISTAGVMAFTPWPATARITVAADRDEGVGEAGHEGSHAGEKAARTFGVRNRAKAFAVTIAMPGKAGEKVDWLDILRRDGVDAVHNGILNAERYIATQAEIDQERKNRGRAAELRQVAEDYPLPVLGNFRFEYKHDQHGVVKLHLLVEEMDDDGEKQERFIPVTTPFAVVSRLRQADRDDGYAIRVAVRDMAGQCRPVNFDRGQLARQSGAGVMELLYKDGLCPDPDGEKIIINILKAAAPDHETVAFHRAGWQAISGRQLFICPDGRTIGAPENTDIELIGQEPFTKPSQAGTLEGWRAAVERVLDIENTPHWQVGVLTGIVGPLLALLGGGSAGISLSGRTSRGKTIAMRLAASAWAFPREDQGRNCGLLRTANTTLNAVEADAERASGAVLLLDDLKLMRNDHVAELVYKVISGSGKARQQQSSNKQRECAEWQAFVMFTDEHSLRSRVQEGGRTLAGGMAVRILDIDVSDVNDAVAKADIDAFQTHGIELHYGHAGPTFVQGLLDNGYLNKLQELQQQVGKTAADLAGADIGPYGRAAETLALLHVAGLLAKKFRILPERFDVAETVKWAWQSFIEGESAGVLDAGQEIVDNLRDWIAKRWGSSIRNVEASDTQVYRENAGQDGQQLNVRVNRVNNRDAEGWYDEDTVYIPVTLIVKAAGGAFTKKQIGKELGDRGLLMKTTSQKHKTYHYVPQVGKVTCYALKRAEVGREFMLNDDIPF